jgi:hypothetical protein
MSFLQKTSNQALLNTSYEAHVKAILQHIPEYRATTISQLLTVLRGNVYSKILRFSDII